MAIVLRATKGAPLTHAELDNNFSELNNGKVSVSAFNFGSILYRNNVGTLTPLVVGEGQVVGRAAGASNIGVIDISSLGGGGGGALDFPSLPAATVLATSTDLMAIHDGTEHKRITLDQLIQASHQWEGSPGSIHVDGMIGIGEISSGATVHIKVQGVALEEAIRVQNDIAEELFKLTADGNAEFKRGSVFVFGDQAVSGDKHLVLRHYGATGVSKIGISQNATATTLIGWMEVTAGEFTNFKTYTPSRYISIFAGNSIKAAAFMSTYVEFFNNGIKLPRVDVTTVSAVGKDDVLCLDSNGVPHYSDGTNWIAV